MEKEMEYSFEDEVVNKFCFDSENKKIEIHFGGYHDVFRSIYVNKPCIWVIENWNDAKSKLSAEGSYCNLEQHLGIISMILSLEFKKTILEVTVNTIDDRYVDLLFDSPQLKLI